MLLGTGTHPLGARQGSREEGREMGTQGPRQNKPGSLWRKNNLPLHLPTNRAILVKLRYNELNAI